MSAKALFDEYVILRQSSEVPPPPEVRKIEPSNEQVSENAIRSHNVFHGPADAFGLPNTNRRPITA
jgi:hypothetical protein